MRHYGIIILEMCAKCVPTLSFYMIPYDFKIAVSLDNTEFMILHYSSKLIKNALLVVEGGLVGKNRDPALLFQLVGIEEGTSFVHAPELPQLTSLVE